MFILIFINMKSLNLSLADLAKTMGLFKYINVSLLVQYLVHYNFPPELLRQFFFKGRLPSDVHHTAAPQVHPGLAPAPATLLAVRHHY